MITDIVGSHEAVGPLFLAARKAAEGEVAKVAHLLTEEMAAVLVNCLAHGLLVAGLMVEGHTASGALALPPGASTQLTGALLRVFEALPGRE